MNFKDEIKLLLENENLLTTQKDNYLIVKSVAKSSDRIRFYGIDMNKPIGEGSGSKVYKAYPIDPKSGALNEDLFFAAKIFGLPAYRIEKEADILKHYYQTEAPIFNESSAILITQYL